MSFLNNLITGISLGSVYAIIALGYTMVYGIAKMLNFAHGDVIMVGAYVCFFAVTSFGLHPFVGLLLAILVCTLLGIIIERLAYKPLRQAPSLAVLITAIGVSYFLQNAALLLWKSDPKSFPPIVSRESFWLSVTPLTLVTILTCIVVMLVLTWFTSRTKMGKAMRACSENKDAAMLMGIDVDRTISVTFAIGSALAAIAGVLYCSAYQNLMPTTGALPGIKAFTAAVFGGIGSIPGALLGGILLGVIETFAKVVNSAISDAVTFAVLIVVLLVKPAGLLGKTVREKV
ncbi:MAG: branched-chain amino acid ABC transporter permease [Oscillospiraceae bacterium]|nr:branched-chain amino acid ABC transporter permease [Oscillospiraceae bacterium]